MLLNLETQFIKEAFSILIFTGKGVVFHGEKKWFAFVYKVSLLSRAQQLFNWIEFGFIRCRDTGWYVWNNCYYYSCLDILKK